MKRICIGLMTTVVMGATMLAVYAEPNAIFSGTSASTVYNWADANAWKDGYCPTNEGDVVSLVGTLSKVHLCINQGLNFAIDSICDCPADTKLRFEQGAAPSTITVRQMGSYISYWPIAFWNNQNWKVNAAYSGFVFTGDETEPTLVNSYYVGTLPRFTVPAANGKARINRMMHKGMFAKDGQGELTVAGPVGLDSGVFASDGTFGIDAFAESSDDSPAQGAFCHLDSSRNLDTFIDEISGREYVTNWYDAAGSDFKAYNKNWVYNEISWGCPYIASKMVNGRRLVDFGKYRAISEAPGDDSPSGALNWSATAANIREIFMAVEMKEDLGTVSSVAPIGNSGACPYLMYSTTNYLFKQTSIVCPADVRVDGAPLVPQEDQSDPLRVRIISCKTQEGQTANALGRVAYAGRGGFLLGEVLVYTNELTEAERRQTIAYLKKRWISSVERPVERAEWDFGDVAVSNAAILVEAGRTARVKRVQDTCAAVGIESDGIVKKGDGTLVADRVVPATAEISVEGGSVEFSQVAASPAGNALPQGVLINFDAESSSFDYDGERENDITAWRSLANGALYVATNMIYKGERTICPKRVPAATPTGLHAIDFLKQSISYNNTNNPRFSFPVAPVYSGFIVWKNNYDLSYRASHFCDSTNVMLDRTKGQLLAYKKNAALGPIAGMNWRVNGIAVNPFEQTFAAMHGDGAAEDCEWVLISFDSSVPVELNGMAQSISGQSGGGCLVAALVGYDRPLADHERREAEAYLMKRFLGKNHPDSVEWQGSLKFGEGVENSIRTDADISPSEISFSSSSFVKSGFGTMNIGASLSSVSSVSVEEGRLEGTVLADLCADAYARFDASDVSSLEMADNGDGTYSVSNWYDVRRNGIYATADLVHCKSMPRYTTASDVGILPGLGYVDFGPTSIPVSGVATNEHSAAMEWNEPSTAVCEVHIVYADSDYAIDNSKVGNPVAYNINSLQSGFIRQYSKGLLYNAFDNMLCDTVLDGSSVAQTLVKPEGFNVVSFVVTNHCGALELGRIGTFCNERNLAMGGCKIAEVIVFETEQTSERRSAIDAMLLKKWRGIGDGISIEMPSVSVASRASLNAAVVGNDAAVLLSDIDVALDAENCGTIQIDGAVDMSQPATVRISYGASRQSVFNGASFKVLEANELVNAESISAWQLELPADSRLKARLVVSGNAIYVRFDAPGMMLIVR